MERQMFTDYAVIKQGDSYGLIDSDGEILGGMDYEEITSGYGYYLLTREEPVYESEYMTEMDSYYLYGDEILPAVAIAGDAYGFKGAFYYCDGLQNIFDAYGEEAFGPRTWTEPEDAVPVKASDTVLENAMDAGVNNMDEWLADLPGAMGSTMVTAWRRISSMMHAVPSQTDSLRWSRAENGDMPTVREI